MAIYITELITHKSRRSGVGSYFQFTSVITLDGQSIDR